MIAACYFFKKATAHFALGLVRLMLNQDYFLFKGKLLLTLPCHLLMLYKPKPGGQVRAALARRSSPRTGD